MSGQVSVPLVQSREAEMIAAQTTAVDRLHLIRSEYLEVPGTNHFTILDELTQPLSPLSRSVSAMAQRLQIG